jgi:hypothetical protein
MYQWYERSMICYVYLEDFEVSEEMLSMMETLSDLSMAIDHLDALSLQATSGDEGSREGYNVSFVQSSQYAERFSEVAIPMDKPNDQTLLEEIQVLDIAGKPDRLQLNLRYEETGDKNDLIFNTIGIKETDEDAYEMEWPLPIFKCRWWLADGPFKNL